MARPSLITLTILSLQGSWNEFTHFLVVTQSPELRTMITGLPSLTSGDLGSGTQFPLKMAAAMMTTIPVALIFFAFQRHFVRGANEGRREGLSRLPCPLRCRSAVTQWAGSPRHGGCRQVRGRVARNTSQPPVIATIGPIMAHSVAPDMKLPPRTFSP